MANYSFTTYLTRDQRERTNNRGTPFQSSPCLCSGYDVNYGLVDSKMPCKVYMRSKAPGHRPIQGEHKFQDLVYDYSLDPIDPFRRDKGQVRFRYQRPQSAGAASSNEVPMEALYRGDVPLTWGLRSQLGDAEFENKFGGRSIVKSRLCAFSRYTTREQRARAGYNVDRKPSTQPALRVNYSAVDKKADHIVPFGPPLQASPKKGEGNNINKKNSNLNRTPSPLLSSDRQKIRPSSAASTTFRSVPRCAEVATRNQKEETRPSVEVGDPMLAFNKLKRPLARALTFAKAPRGQLPPRR